MKKLLILTTFFFLLLNKNSQGQNQNNISSADSTGIKPGCDCDSLWKKKEATEMTGLLESSTSTKYPVWPGYTLSDGTYIVDAGQTVNGNYCLGLWKKGKAISYARLGSSVKMLTPLYSYYLNYPGLDTIPGGSYFHTADNAPGFVKWMKQNKITSAVYIPVDFSKLPFTIPSIVKVQLAVHEAFHIEVMLKYWYTKKGSWPAWDQQPDRPGVQSCYTYNDSARVKIKKELSILADMIESLLNNDKEKACSLGNEYLLARENRYKDLTEIKIQLADGVNGDCRTAESLLELEEGLADYASWTMLYKTGMVNKETLLRRYRANQNDHFYLSGNMLMHAITLMSKDSPEKIIMEIVNSSSVENGSLLSLFKIKLNNYCNE